MTAAADAAGRVIAVNHNFLGLPSYVRLKRADRRRHPRPHRLRRHPLALPADAAPLGPVRALDAAGPRQPAARTRPPSLCLCRRSLWAARRHRAPPRQADRHSGRRHPPPVVAHLGACRPGRCLAVAVAGRGHRRSLAFAARGLRRGAARLRQRHLAGPARQRRRPRCSTRCAPSLPKPASTCAKACATRTPARLAQSASHPMRSASRRRSPPSIAG